MESLAPYLAHTILAPDPEDSSIGILHGLDIPVTPKILELAFRVAKDHGFSFVKYYRRKNGVRIDKIFPLDKLKNVE